MWCSQWLLRMRWLVFGAAVVHMCYVVVGANVRELWKYGGWSWELGPRSRFLQVKLWRVPETGLTEHIKEPLSVLSSHTKRVANLAFHPIASNLLLTSGGDYSVRYIYVTTLSLMSPAKLRAQKLNSTHKTAIARFAHLRVNWSQNIYIIGKTELLRA